jgi:xanthine dehydrogenase YagS FAD-binding subunit
VNIKEIQELRGIRPAGGALRIGALVTIQDLLDNAQVRRSYPALWQAAEAITSPQIRSLGTAAGDLCQRPRCWYYRAGFGLLGTDESGASLVATGDNRYHAILGNSGPAYFVNPSSLAPALIAYRATIRIYGPNGSRETAAESFFRIPKSNDDREYDLKANEIVSDILLPSTVGVRSATYEVRQRETLDWPLATASVALKMNGKEVSSARVVLGHVAPIPWHSTEAGAFLVGKTINEETAKAAGDLAVKKARDLGRNGYKIQLARVAVKRAILAAAK